MLSDAVTNLPHFTFAFIKPDAIDRGLTLQIIDMIKQRGFKFELLWVRPATESLLRHHYRHHAGKDFFEPMIAAMRDREVICLVLTLGAVEDAPSALRLLVGTVQDPAPGTIRAQFGADGWRNLIHASDSVFSAREEAEAWSNDPEIASFKGNSTNAGPSWPELCS